MLPMVKQELVVTPLRRHFFLDIEQDITLNVQSWLRNSRIGRSRRACS